MTKEEEFIEYLKSVRNPYHFDTDEFRVILHSYAAAVEAEKVKMAINEFKHIAEIAKRLTTGNVAHNGKTIEGIARHTATYLERNQIRYQPKQEG